MQRKNLDAVESDDPRKAEITLKAATTVTTEEGAFTAVISTESVDREGDVVDADAMVKALQAWALVGKMVPLAWEHSTAPDDIFGHIDPSTAKALDGRVVADGWVDQATDRGKQVWRLVKSGTLGFSFGYLTLKASKRRPHGRHITELDVFEVSGTMTPMNADTRVLAWKSALEAQFETELQEVKGRLDKLEQALEDQKNTAEVTGQETKSRPVDPLRQQAEKTALDIASGGLDQLPHRQAAAPEPAPDLLDLGELKQRSRDLMLQVLSGVDNP
jgi:HK97 family phage prohead protease